MCNLCLPILGPNCRPHTEIDCPIKKAMNCSICGKGKHFMKDCPLKSENIKNIYMPSIKLNTSNTYNLSNKNTVYIEYLRSRGQQFEIPIAINRKLVQSHLLKNGYILANPIENHTTLDCGCNKCKI
jgi:hypothetical protein